MVGAAGEFAVDALDGPDGGAVLADDAGHLLVAQAESLDARIVAAVELPADHHTDTQSRAESVAQQIAVTLGAAGLFEPGVHLGQGPAEGLAVSEEIAVVVDEDGDAELHFEERPQSYAVAERGEIGEVTSDDAVGVVGRTGEGEADGHGLLVEPGDDFEETPDHGFEALVQIVRLRGVGDGLDDELVGPHGTENEVGASGVEGDDDAVVVGIHKAQRMLVRRVNSMISGMRPKASPTTVSAQP